MKDIVIVTADSVRYDYADELEAIGDGEMRVGIAASHYTRPSLASIHSSSYEAAITTEVKPPTLASVLREQGYTSFGFSPTPNTDSRFGFDSGFDVYNTYVPAGSEGSSLRQYLSKSTLVRKLYYKFNPPQAKSANRPDDRAVIDDAIDAFNAESSPRFLWLHLMGSHRPYGSGEDALSKRLDQKAFFNPTKLTREERETIDRTYRRALRRVVDDVSYLRQELQTDASQFVFTSDHGEAFGEPGFFFHQGQERCVDDVQTKVPVYCEGVEMNGPLSLIDIAPTVLDNIGCSIPDSWHGESRVDQPAESTLTIAPWHDKATLAWQDFDTKIVARNASVTLETDNEEHRVTKNEVDTEIHDRLRDLGYRDAG